MSWNDHDHRGEYAADGHDHYDYAREHHRHYDLENAGEKAQRRITALQDEVDGLRGQLAGALERITVLEKHTPQARQFQLEADQAVADLAGSGYDRHGRDCQCPFCFYDPEEDGAGTAPGALTMQAEITADDAVRQVVAEPPDICPETSDGYHCTHYQEGVSHCCACGSDPEGAPGEPDEEPPAAEYDPGPEIDDEGGMSEYRYMLPGDYERGQS
jgi:hypothetical protein